MDDNQRRIMGMAVPLLDLRLQYDELREPIQAALAEVVETQQFILGPVVEALETDIARMLGSPHAIGCASGTDALLLALRALQLDPGDEVVVPAFTFFATAGAVWNAGQRPAFADIDAETNNISPETLLAALTERTRAIIVVHLFGQMAPMQPLLEVAAQRGLAVIEDVAQAFGARQQVGGHWRVAGTLGEAGCFSFFPTKVLGGFGDGGLVTTADDSLAERIRTLRVHGARQLYRHELVGTNSRLDALQAAALRVKLPHVPKWLEQRRRVAVHYDELLAPLASRVQTPRVAAGNQPAWNVYTARVERRDELKRFLDQRGIGNAIYYPVPLHLQPCFESLGYRTGQLPVSEQAAREVLSLPIYPELNEQQLQQVVNEIGSFYSGHGGHHGHRGVRSPAAAGRDRDPT